MFAGVGRMSSGAAEEAIAGRAAIAAIAAIVAIPAIEAIVADVAVAAGAARTARAARAARAGIVRRWALAIIAIMAVSKERFAGPGEGAAGSAEQRQLRGGRLVRCGRAGAPECGSRQLRQRLIEAVAVARGGEERGD